MENNKGSSTTWAILGGIVIVFLLIALGFRVTSISVPVGPVGIGLEKQEHNSEPDQDLSDNETNQQSNNDVQVQDDAESYIPGAIANPSRGTIMSSDSPVLVDDYLLTYGHNFEIGSSCINLGNFRIKNLSQRQRTFSFMYASVSVTDDLGNSYPIRNTDDVYELRSLNLDPSDNGETGWATGCGCNCSGTGFTYEGTLSSSANALILSFDRFGAFDGFSIKVDIR